MPQAAAAAVAAHAAAVADVEKSAAERVAQHRHARQAVVLSPNVSSIVVATALAFAETPP